MYLTCTMNEIVKKQNPVRQTLYIFLYFSKSKVFIDSFISFQAIITDTYSALNWAIGMQTQRYCLYFQEGYNVLEKTCKVSYSGI